MEMVWTNTVALDVSKDAPNHLLTSPSQHP